MTEKYTRGPDVTDSWWCCGGGTDNGHAPWCKSKGVYTREEFIMQHATRNSALHIIGLTVATFALAFVIEAGGAWWLAAVHEFLAMLTDNVPEGGLWKANLAALLLGTVGAAIFFGAVRLIFGRGDHEPD